MPGPVTAWTWNLKAYSLCPALSAAWELPDGTCLGLATPRQTGVAVRFWEDGKLHPDASVSFPRVELAPNDVFDVPGRPFVLGACCREGLSVWHGLCKELRDQISRSA